MTTTQKTSVQILDDQKKRLASLQERRTRIQVRVETERRTLTEAQQEAIALFDTADLDQLRKIYRERQELNDRVVVEFVMSLDDIEQKLGDIESQINF